MRTFDFSFASANTVSYTKRITAFVVEPNQITADTALLHCAHGWGGNRFQYTELMKDFAERYNLVCLATEFRQSGYDFDSITGIGSDVPYDASHYQVLDCLNAIREILGLYPVLNRQRMMLFGGSQGAHITMLMTIFAPNTFACAIAGSGIARMDAKCTEWARRDFSADELACRDVIRMASQVRCPVALMHGTSDDIVPDSHTRELEAALRSAGTIEIRVKYYEGAGHSLGPVTDRKTATIEIADELLREARRTAIDDFTAGTKIIIPCVSKDLVLDWSKEVAAADLMCWEARKSRE